jgi:hypothetical protein
MSGGREGPGGVGRRGGSAAAVVVNRIDRLVERSDGDGFNGVLHGLLLSFRIGCCLIQQFLTVVPYIPYVI